jgi:hypothetical protein
MLAASRNNIDISDLIESAANENSGFSATASSSSFERAMRSVSDEAHDNNNDDNGNSPTRNDEYSRPAETSSYSGKPAYESRPLMSSSPLPSSSAAPFDAEAFRLDVIAAEKRAVRKGVFASLLLILILGGVSGAVLMSEMGDDRARLFALETKTGSLDKRVGLLEQGKSLVSSVVPEDVQQKLSSVEEQITTLSQQIQSGNSNGLIADANALMPRVAALEAQLGQMASASGLTTLIGHLRQLQQSQEGQQQLAGVTHDLYTALQNVASGGDLDHVLAQAMQGASMGDAVKGMSSDSLKSAALAIALADLNASLGRSAPFDEDLQLLSLLLGDRMPGDIKAAIEQLAPQAKQGVLTQPALVDQLKNLAPEIVDASLDGQDVSIKDKAMARLNDLVQVSKDGTLVTGTDSQAIVMRAQDALEKGDVQAAVKELQGLQGGAANTAKPFIDAASATVLAGRLQGSIQSMMSSILGVGGAPLTTQDAGLLALARRAGDMAPGPAIVTDKASGFAILPQQH